MNEDKTAFFELLDCDHPYIVDINAATGGKSILMCTRCGEILDDIDTDEDNSLQDI